MAFSASSDFIHLQLRALQENNRLEVLSNPQVMTMNNQLATIAVGQKVPRFHGMVPTGWQGQERADIKDEDVELSLAVTPTISPDGTIVMTLVVQNQKLGATVTIQDQPMQVIDNTRIGTQISAADNETVVLGGLITREEEKTLRKVPLLGDIPLIGKFFRQEFNQTRRKELLIVLTPRIVRSPEEMEQIKQMEMARMSWCLKNVSEVAGDVGAYNVAARRPYTGDAPVIRPPPVRMETLQPLGPQPYIAPVLPRRN